MKKVLLINGAVLLAGLLVVEAVFGNWLFPGRLNMLYILRNVSRTADVSHLYKSENGKAQYTRDANGLRGSFGEVTSVNVLSVGGSTTDQRYIADNETWQEHLSRCAQNKGLELRIANAGIDGQSSYGHYLALTKWLNTIEGLHPKTVLVYLGTNDFIMSETLLPSRSESLYGVWFKNSVVAFVARTVIGNALASKGRVFHQPVDFSSWQWGREHSLESPAAAAMLIESKRRSYKARLLDVINQIKTMGARPVLISQWEHTAKMLDGLPVGTLAEKDLGGKKVFGLDHLFVMQAFHEMTKEAATETGAEFIDVAGALIFEDGDFYDSVHNTPAGSRKLGEYLCAQSNSNWSL